MKDLTNYEYTALVETMTDLLKDQPGWGDGYESSVGQTLIQLMADVTDNLHFMLERRAQEAFISTARIPSSIIAHASELGYRSRRKVSSTGTIRLTLLDEDDNPIAAQGRIDISAGTALTAVDENFVTADDVFINAGESYVDIPIKEGLKITKTYDFTSDPYLTDPTIVIKDYIDIEEYSLQVGDRTGTFSDIAARELKDKNIVALSYALPSDKVYDIKYAMEGMRIVFGDNEFGRSPTGIVTIEWVQSKGDDVGVIVTGREFSMESEFLFDNEPVSPRNAYLFTMENITPIRGGADEETSEDIAANAAVFARTSNRAVTNQDYEFITLRSGIGSIVDVHSYGEHEIDSLIYKMNNVFLSYITSDNLPLNIEQRKQLREYVDRFKIITTHLVISESDKIEAVLDVEFKRHPSLPIADAHLYDVLVEDINAFFELTRGSISKEIQHSELIRHLQNRTYTFNGVVYPITDFVRVDMTAQYEITPLETVYDVLIDIDPFYTPVAGHNWTISLDGIAHTITVETNDTIPIIIAKMRDEIFEQTNFLLAINDEVTLRIKSAFIDARFTLDLTTGDFASAVSSDVVYAIPDPRSSEFSEVDGILAGSVSLVDENENILFTDDGEGLMVPEPGVVLPEFGINYRNSTLLSPPFDSTIKYYVRYQQNRWQNIATNDNTVVVLSKFAESFADTPLYSKIEIL